MDFKMEADSKDDSKKEDGPTSSQHQKTKEEEIKNQTQNILPSSDDSCETLNANNFEKWLRFNKIYEDFKPEDIPTIWDKLTGSFGLNIRKVK